MADLQPRELTDAPRGIWLLASGLREERVPVGARYPHICGIEVPGQDLEALAETGERPKTYWSRDCAACWDAGWRPRDWEDSVRRARLAVAAAMVDPNADPGSAPPPPKKPEES